ncbi:uncharacterized protein LOC134078918 [Sardina pilchardus]|uniref:uncharacterized protein LOC134078918 n=1 Tax=Sardina pilchardus TaxID=27697 RepID=UPI002E1447F2
MGSKTVVGILFLLANTLAPRLERKVYYGAKYGSIVLSVQLPDGTIVSSIGWKHNENIAADWDKGDKAPVFYGIFNSTSTTCTLDVNTGALTISNLHQQFAGEYLAKVNDVPTQSLRLAVVDAVPVRGMKGQSITLKPDVPNVDVQSVQWTLNSTVIAHWDGGESETLNETMVLDSETFSLTISDLQQTHSGLYTFTDGFRTLSYLLTVRDTNKNKNKNISEKDSGTALR